MGTKKNLFIPFIILLLYLFTPFIPSFGAFETKNTHWLYLGILNTLSFFLFFIIEKDFSIPKFSKLTFLYLLLFCLLLLLAIGSSAWAINANETLMASISLGVALMTLISLLIWVNILPYQYKLWIIYGIVLSLLVENLHIIDHFLTNKKEIRSSKLLQKLTHNYSNYNILSASLVLKVPFAFYIMLQNSKFWKYLAIFTIAVTFSATLFISARTGFYNLLIISTLFFGYMVVLHRKTKSWIPLATLIAAIVISIFFTLHTNRITSYKMNSIAQMFYPDQRPIKYYEVHGNSAAFTNLSGREAYWNNAVTTFKNHPIKGVGFANWKLDSKEDMLKGLRKDISFLPYRVHNDFLQMAAELGIAGLLLFSSLFVLLFYVSIKNYLHAKDTQKELSFCLFLSLLVLLSDSLLNFPFERPGIVILFGILSSFIFLQNRNRGVIQIKLLKGIAIVLVLLSGSLAYLEFNLFSSSVFQKKMFVLTQNKTPQEILKQGMLTYQSVLNKTDNFYNELGDNGASLESYKAIYAKSEKKYTKAILHYKKALQQMPSNHMPQREIASIYFEMKKLDSAYRYSNELLARYPTDKNSYLIVKDIYKKRKDTVKVLQVIDTFLYHSPKDIKTWMSKAYNHYSYYKNAKTAKEIIQAGIKENPRNKKELLEYGKRFR